jgi:transcriptional regulator with XRE-family HTH domain
MERPRQKPLRLAEKLLRIRTALGLSQNEMIRSLGFDGELIQAHISAYERKRENRIPPLGVVLQYARCAGVEMEVLVDDSFDLPDTLPLISRGRNDKRKQASKGVKLAASKRA